MGGQILFDFTATCREKKPVSMKNQKPILREDVDYFIAKVIGIKRGETDESEVVLNGVRALLIAQYGGELSLQASGKELKHMQSVSHICYFCFHRPTRTESPIYSHAFKKNGILPIKVRGLTAFGLMRLYPAETVWPELTKKGYYGELPQFYT